MAAIKAHFDGRVFVPDEPVELSPGQRVVVQQLAEGQAVQARGSDVSFLRRLNINLDDRLLGEILDDPELSIENL
jgi:hypothetical protein